MHTSQETHPSLGEGKGAEGFRPDRGLRLSKGDSYIKILGYDLCLEII